MPHITVDYTTKADGWNNSALTPKGIMVHATATPGVMAKQFRDRWNKPDLGKSIHAFVDDKDIIQCLPFDKRAGHAGGAANRTHIGFEICEPAGHRYEGGRIVGYDTEKNQPYFDGAWANSVYLAATLCKQFNLDPLGDGVIVDHAEGYKRGIASNHSDVMHWWPQHGKDMDDFRRAVFETVTASMEPEDDGRYQTLDEVPEWAQPTIDNLIKKGALKGDGAGLNLSEDMVRLLVINDRFGLYG